MERQSVISYALQDPLVVAILMQIVLKLRAMALIRSTLIRRHILVLKVCPVLSRF